MSRSVSHRDEYGLNHAVNVYHLSPLRTEEIREGRDHTGGARRGQRGDRKEKKKECEGAEGHAGNRGHIPSIDHTVGA